MSKEFRAQCIHQTDYRAKFPNKQDFGCFVATIRHCVESKFQQAFTMNQWSQMWKRAVDEGAISDKGFVNDHEHVGNIALDIIGKWDEGYRFHYVSIHGPNGVVIREFRPDFKHETYQKGLVWDTESGVHMNYGEWEGNEIMFDPYPGLNLRGLETVRNYYIGGRL